MHFRKIPFFIQVSFPLQTLFPILINNYTEKSHFKLKLLFSFSYGNWGTLNFQLFNPFISLRVRKWSRFVSVKGNNTPSDRIGQHSRSLPEIKNRCKSLGPRILWRISIFNFENQKVYLFSRIVSINQI